MSSKRSALSISYMGTKRRLAPTVAALAEQSAAGPLLDLFSGMCSVARAVSAQRSVWTNDLQLFASNYGAALVAGGNPSISLINDVVRYVTNSRASLPIMVEKASRKERQLLDECNVTELAGFNASLEHELSSCAEQLYFSAIYSGSYLGLEQCIELDAIRAWIDTIECKVNQRWALIALCAAVFRCSTSTGHFAQYLKPKPSNLTYYQRKRRRSLLNDWVEAYMSCKPLRSKAWRKSNKAFNEDAITLLKHIRDRSERPSVLYADPPYTRDHYSRYYHLYETVWLNDKPNTRGVGRCRDDVAPSCFSLKSKVASAMHELIDLSAEIGADLIMSYPTNGIYVDADKHLLNRLRDRYRNVRIERIQGEHSTLGASKGTERNAVTELLFLARGAR